MGGPPLIILSHLTSFALLLRVVVSQQVTKLLLLQVSEGKSFLATIILFLLLKVTNSPLYLFSLYGGKVCSMLQQPKATVAINTLIQLHLALLQVSVETVRMLFFVLS